MCKCCKNKFGYNIKKFREATIYCPHCKKACDAKKDKETHIVFKCSNNKCAYYINNYKKLTTDQKKELRMYGKDYKLHYIYRHSKIDISSLLNDGFEFKNGLDITKKHYPAKIISLCVTFNINYGLSYRKTALILKEVFGIKISYSTVKRYVALVSKSVQYLVDNYEYDLTNLLSADETYVTVKKANNYVFFFSDPTKKFITSYNIFSQRNTLSAIKSFFKSIIKYKSIPKNFTFVVDGNPIYKSAQLYFKNNDIDFELKVVIGLQNSNEEEKKYRPYKQTQERLNRTFNFNYNTMNGFNNLNDANTYMVVFVAYFNFLRVHSSLNYRPPVELDIFEDDDLIYDKWTKLINYSLAMQKAHYRFK